MKRRKSYVIKYRIGKSKFINWDKVTVNNDNPMSGEQIAKEIHRQTGVKITRQGVSNAIKIAMRKIFNNLKEMEKDISNFNTALRMFEILCPNQPSCEDAETFFKLFPDDICEAIKEELSPKEIQPELNEQ